MKRHLPLILVLLLIGGMTGVFAKNLAGVKIYLNAGHGGWNGANDRHIPTIPFPEFTDQASQYRDTLGFWESSSNLKVAEDLETMLLNSGATVYMSRRTNQSGTRDNGAYDWDGLKIGVDKDSILDPMVGDRNLQQIAAEASALNVDAFISIHSNAIAIGKATNYVVLMLPASASAPAGWDFTNYAKPQDVAMATAMWPYVLDNPLDVYSSDSDPAKPNIPCVSDYTLLKDNNLTVPGFIYEASFHTYMPNTHRFLNRDYQYMEALRLHYFYCDFFGAERPTTACLCGDVRSGDYRAKIKGYTDYISGSKDQWTPLNGAKVTLLQGTTVLKTYTVDNYYNGMYCFRELQPGNYTLRFEYADYTTQEVAVVAEAGKITTTNVLLSDPNFVPITHASFPDFPVYAPEKSWNATATLALSSTPSSNVLDGVNIRRAIVRGEKTYVLTDDNKIILVNTLTGEKIKELSTVGVSEGTRLLSDIAFSADGFLFACNANKINYYDTNVHFKLYKWESDDADPVVVFKNSGNNVNANWTDGLVGESMAFRGNSWEFKLYMPVATAASSGKIRIMGLHYNAEDEVLLNNKYMFDENNQDALSYAALGNDVKLSPSPFNEDAFIIDSKSIKPMDMQFDWNAVSRSPLVHKGTAENIDAAANDMAFFRYSNDSSILMVAPVVGTNGVEFYYAKNGLSNAYVLASANATKAEAKHPMFAGFMIDSSDNISLYTYAKGLGSAIYAVTLGQQATSIEDVKLQGEVKIYNLGGMLMYQGNADQANLLKGVYIVQQGETCKKVIF